LILNHFLNFRYPNPVLSRLSKFEMRLRPDLVAQTAVADCTRHRLCIHVIREPKFNPARLVQRRQVIR